LILFCERIEPGTSFPILFRRGTGIKIFGKKKKVLKKKWLELPVDKSLKPFN